MQHLETHKTDRREPEGQKMGCYRPAETLLELDSQTPYVSVSRNATVSFSSI
jgi:hypothetical protein